MDRSVTDRIIRHLVEISNGSFNLSHQAIFSEKNENIRELLFGLIYLNEDLNFNREEAQKVSDLQREKSIAERSAAFKTQFLANMSHEIRTPLNGIIGMVDLMMHNDTLNDQTKEQVEIIQSSSSDLLNILNDVLDLSKIEAGEIILHHQVFDLHHLIYSVSNLFKTTAANKMLSIQIEIAENVPRWIESDRTRLAQVLSNLVGNAVKFTKDGSICITLNIMKQNQQQSRFKIEVIDTGVGVAEDTQLKLFDEFYQIDQSLATTSKGTGLGLSISKKLVELMQGSMGVNSQLGKGSTFWFTFDGKLVNKSLKLNNSLDQNILPKYNYRILVVDDNVVNLKITKLMLQKFGCEVELCINAQKAMEIIVPFKYDLIFIDIQMPILDGIELTQILRKTVETLPPIIALSANAMEGDAQKYIDLGVDDYVSKPLTMRSLKAVLKKWSLLLKA